MKIKENNNARMETILLVINEQRREKNNQNKRVECKIGNKKTCTLTHTQKTNRLSIKYVIEESKQQLPKRVTKGSPPVPNPPG